MSIPSESLGRCSLTKTTMRALLIVPGQLPRQISSPSLRRGEWDRIGPFAQERLDEALGLTIGFRRVWTGADMLDPEHPQGLSVEGDVIILVSGARLTLVKKADAAA